MTGITKQQVQSQEVFGTNVNDESFMGTRFRVDQTWITNRIGGHFVGGPGEESFFGAIVSLTSSTDVPDSDDLSTLDVLGVAKMLFPAPSAEIFGDISVMLRPGWYAVVFGSGRFGATGKGAAVFNGVDIADPAYIAWGSEGWFNPPDFFDNHRFVVEGTVVPEPASFSLLVTSLALAYRMNLARRTKD
jgi:hypothetical protein